MSTPSLPRAALGRSIQAGFSLVELMVAMTIGLFISAALGAVFINSKSAFNSQDQLAQLQDNERLAMTLLTASIEAAGYFPNPEANSRAALLPSVAAPLSAGTFPLSGGITGVSGGAGGAGEMLATRYVVASTDAQTSCLNDAPAGGAALTTFVNVFTVNANNELTCAVKQNTGAVGTATPLVSGVQSFAVMYGVDTSASGNVTRYVPASSMTAALWASAKTAQITINFVNPYAATTGQATIQWVTTISLMNSL